MSETSDQQARRHTRYRRNRPVVVGSPDGADCRYLLLEVVGRGGAELLCESEVPTGALLDLEICLSGGVIRVRARVIECRGVAGDYRVGVEFVEMAEEDEPLLAALLAGVD
jgi:hypothetical protein